MPTGENSSFLSDKKNNEIGNASKFRKNGEEKVDGLEKVTDK
jgi:hypothetical protein